MSGRIKSYYENYDEDGRLFRDKAHLPEWLTTIRYFDRLFPPGSQILDACAGTGRYSFYLAEKGHFVTACDLVERHVESIQNNPNAKRLSGAMVCDVLDLSRFRENSFDAVLCMGAMYHLASDYDKQKAISQCVRICTKGGFVALSYLNKTALIAAEVLPGLVNIRDVMHYAESPESFFQSTTPEKMARFAEAGGLDILYHLGTDGISYILRDKVNVADDENFNRWMEFIYDSCENFSAVGYSMHGLLIGKKKE